MKENKIIKLSDREHILKRPSMYIGSIKNEVSDEYILKEQEFVIKSVKRTPGLIKILNEIIDNSIDEAIRTDFKYSNKIEVNMTKDYFSVKDNGRGIPIHEITLEDNSVMLSPEVCWTQARAGSNFSDNSNTIGANGVGSALTAIFSKKFIGETDDGKNRCRVVCSNNNSNTVSEIISKSSKTGVFVKSYPDFEKLDEKEFTESYFDIIKTRLAFLSVSYPKITFYFNDNKIQIKAKDFFSYFTQKEVITIQTDNYSIGITLSDSDEFKQFTLMNGLLLKQGGSCVDYLANNIASKVKDKLSKKYNSLKPADVKNKLFIISILNNFIDAKYDSQTKERLTNSQKEIQEYFNIDLDSLANKVYKQKDIISSITDYFKIKEEFKKKQELKSLEKTKKIKSEKYISPIGEEKYLILCEGYSAVSGLMACLGRKGIGYFELRGKPLNVCGEKSITQNKELSELYKILKNTNYKKIIIGSDFDLDGTHICSLLLCFFRYYCPERLNDIARLRTPIAISTKNKEIIDWTYEFEKVSNLKGDITYMKGLGSWDKKSLDKVIEKESFDNMLLDFSYTEKDDESILNWFSKEQGKEDKRKEMIKESSFSLIKL